MLSRAPEYGCFGRQASSSSCRKDTSLKGRSPEVLDFFIWTTEDVGAWLDGIGLGGYKEAFKQNQVNGEYLDNLSTFTTEQILRFIRRCHMKWGDFITLCKELRRVKVACLQGEQEFRSPWWAPCCLSSLFMRVVKQNRQSRVVSLKFDPWVRFLLTVALPMVHMFFGQKQVNPLT